MQKENKYEVFYKNLLEQVAQMMENDPPVDSEEGKLLIGVAEMVAKAEEAAGWVCQ